MDTLDTLAIVSLPIAALGIVAAATLGIALEAAPALARRRRMGALALEVQRLADEHAATPPPRRRHAHHCPACGRFAQLVSAGPRGTWTRCRAHGLRVRPTRRIGRPEGALVGLTLH